ncbi:MAG: DNA polymerase III subunit epsilon [Gammaproteobacteria bacterium]|nr:DNA polymerase III subunit epsilon [Gammaproteobacteria bacterium]MBQ0838958.1 DNA polymerase III subunit epsilon [Gammaproteobacteria bacterium]
MRQVVLDTETTGLEVALDHRIIEIGCVEIINRKLTGRHFHRYINPQREIDAGAMEVHGISNEDLADKPLFAQVVAEFIDFVNDAELVIHNAPFDLGFLNAEIEKLGGQYQPLERDSGVVDTLIMARQMHPGQRNSLDALCKRYGVDNSQRTLHGALLDAEILADVYLLMTGGQVDLVLGANSGDGEQGETEPAIRRLSAQRQPLKVIRASDTELALHQQKLEQINQSSAQACRWPLAER